MSPHNTAQAVDIDYSALSDTLRRSRKGKARLLQSPSFSPTNCTREVSLDEVGQSGQGVSSIEENFNHSSSSSDGVNGSSTSSTWDQGATSERFERKFQARLKKEKKKKDVKSSSNPINDGEGLDSHLNPNTPRLTLLQSDVLELPVPPIPSSSSSKSTQTSSESELPPADLIASLNYAMCYFHSRSTLISYLKVALKTLRPKTGVFVTDLFGGPPTGENYLDQKPLWDRFEKELGFNSSKRDVRRRVGEENSNGLSSGKKREVNGEIENEDDRLAGKVEIHPAPLEGTKGTPAEWPGGKLKMVRKGTEHGGFE